MRWTCGWCLCSLCLFVMRIRGRRFKNTLHKLDCTSLFLYATGIVSIYYLLCVCDSKRAPMLRCVPEEREMHVICWKSID